MKQKVIAGIMLTLLFTSMLTLAFNIQQVKAEPKTVHVDASNIDDPLEDGTISHPFDKIQEGIDAASSGDTVLVAAGTYYENIILKDGARVQGAGVDVTTIDGGGAENVVLAEWIADPTTVISGFTITNGQNGIRIKTYSLTTISNCIVTGNQGDGIKCKDSNPTITNCVIIDNGHGISCEGCNPTISNCTIADNGGGIGIDRSLATIICCTLSRDGISVGPESLANITNCVIADGGVRVYDWYGRGTAHGKITNCLIAGYDGPGVYVAYGDATVTNSILWGNGGDLVGGTGSSFTVTYSDIQDSYPGEGNICAYPMFVDPWGGDFHLGTGSPCIDAGTNQGAPTEDIEGNPRPIDGDEDGTATTDMGPYEYTGPPPPPPERPAEVWVDDDYYEGGPNDGHTWNYDAFDKIQDGIDAVASLGTVYVAAGYYYENVILKDGVQVTGAGADLTTIDGGEAENVVLAEWTVAPETVISGFTITNGQNGIRIKRHSIITISNCIVRGNHDGIRCENSNPTITNCVVTRNQGSGISCDNSNPTITYCTITDHGSRGISIDSSTATITGCSVSRNVWFQIEVGPESFANITNCVITDGEHGGVNIYDWYGDYTNNATITNCVIVGFDGSGIGGAYVNTVEVVNCILWANGRDLPDAGDRAYYFRSFTVTYSDIEDGDPGEGNISEWPMFVNPGVDDFHLQAGSPCIDTGTNENAPSADSEGNPRPVDGDGDEVAVVDMGAYEFFPSQHLTIYSSPAGVPFTVDGVFRVTPWSGAYIENAAVSLIMPEFHAVGDARYYWNQWSDGSTSRTRTVTMDTNVALTAYFTGPYYQLTVTSSPVKGITFTIDGVAQTTAYTEWLPEGSYTLEMPQTYEGYIWSHWLEDEDTARTKTVTMDTRIASTAVFAYMFDVVLDDVHYPVSILSNSTVSNFNFHQKEMQISFDVTGESGTTGYCNVTISKGLLKGNPWTIKVDETLITDFDEKTNDTHTFLYFTYIHESPLQVTIKGTWVGPEPIILSIKLSGEHDYLFFENVKIRVAALVTDAETMDPVSGADVVIEIYDPNGKLWTSAKMMERLRGTGIYEWGSTKTVRQLMGRRQLSKGIYLVHVQASYGVGPTVVDILEFHVDPPQEQSIKPGTILLVALIGILGTIASVWYIDHQKLSRKLRELQ